MKNKAVSVALFLFVALVAVAVDQVSKMIVVKCMDPGQSVALVQRFFYLTYVKNPGGAFGILAYKTGLFVILAIIFIIIVLALAVYYPGRNLKLTCSLAILTGGVLGNLIDRLRTGYVVDFLNFRVWPAVFNAADVFIITGAFLMFIILWRKGS